MGQLQVVNIYKDKQQLLCVLDPIQTLEHALCTLFYQQWFKSGCYQSGCLCYHSPQANVSWCTVGNS